LVRKSLSHVAVAPRRLPDRRGHLRFALSEPAAVRIAVDRRAGERPARWRTAGRITRSARAGTTTIAFNGRLAGRALAPGTYRAVVRARDAAGNAFAPITVRFSVLDR
jgi:hypothetical protein